MMSRMGLAVLCAGVLVLTTGCESECETNADCAENNRLPGEGREFACVDNRCELRNTDTPDDTDAGAETDAGEQVDAGEMDAGGQTDGGETDAGQMTVGKGEACTSNANCAPGYFCQSDAAGETDTCESLWISYTVGAGTQARAAAVQWDEPGTHVTLDPASLESRWPRFGPQGDALVFQRTTDAGTPELVRRDFPLSTAAEPTAVVNAAAAATDAFVHLEWAPGQAPLWTRQAMGSLSGIMSVASAGGAPTELSATGVFPTWKATSVVFSSAGQGLLLYDGTDVGAIQGGSGGVEPQTQSANDLIAYRVSSGSQDIGGVITPLDELFVVPLAGGQSVKVAPVTSDDTNPAGSVRSYIASHTWSPSGTLIAFVRAYYSVDTVGNAALCGTVGNTVCPGRAANDIAIVPVTPAGAPGAEVTLVGNATLPSFSPEGGFVAYVQGGQLRVQQIDPATGAAVMGVPAVSHTTSGIVTHQGDDSRPRWQPKP